MTIFAATSRLEERCSLSTCFFIDAFITFPTGLTCYVLWRRDAIDNSLEVTFVGVVSVLWFFRAVAAALGVSDWYLIKYLILEYLLN